MLFVPMTELNRIPQGCSFIQGESLDKRTLVSRTGCVSGKYAKTWVQAKMGRWTKSWSGGGKEYKSGSKTKQEHGYWAGPDIQILDMLL